MKWVRTLMKSGGVALLLGSAIAQGQASGQSKGPITSIAINTVAGNLVLLRIGGTKSNNPACSASSDFQFVLQMQGGISEAMFRILLQARASGAAISLTGTGTCDPTTHVELLKSVEY